MEIKVKIVEPVLIAALRHVGQYSDHSMEFEAYCNGTAPAT